MDVLTDRGPQLLEAWIARGERLAGGGAEDLQRDGSAEVLNLLAECVREARETAHVHPHREVLTLNVGRGNEPCVRIATHYRLVNRNQLGGAVAALICHV